MGSYEFSFFGCSNLQISAIDVPNWSIDNYVLSNAFAGCNSLVTNTVISEWDMYSAFKIDFMFANAANFNANIGNWDVGKVGDFESTIFVGYFVQSRS